MKYSTLLPLTIIAACSLVPVVVACGDDTTSDGTAPDPKDTKADDDADDDTEADDDADDDTEADDDADDDTESDDDDAPAPSGVYALTTRVDDGADGVSYVLLTDTLEADATIDLDDAALEEVGYALGTGIEDSGVVYLATDMAPTVTRYELDGDDRLRESGVVSFQGKGVTYFAEYGSQFQYVSEDKAYWFDGTTAQIVAWNPADMEIVGDVPLDLAYSGETLSFSAAPIRIGTKIYNFAAWREGLVVKARAAVVILDTENDSVKVVEDDTCGWVRDGVLAEDGKMYLATEGFAVAAHYLDDATNPAPCMLRFDTETETFDDFEVTLSTLVDGAATGMLVVGPSNSAFLRYLVDVDTAATVTDPRPLGGMPLWGWAKLSLGDTPKADPIEDVPLSSARVLPLTVGGRTYVPVYGDNETEMVRLGSNGPQENGLKVPGLVFSAVKLR